MLVTGILDGRTDVIRVQKIEEDVGVGSDLLFSASDRSERPTDQKFIDFLS